MSGSTAIPDPLRSLLVCPRCRGELGGAEGLLVCPECARCWPVVEGVPFLIPESSRPWPPAAPEDGPA